MGNPNHDELGRFAEGSGGGGGKAKRMRAYEARDNMDREASNAKRQADADPTDYLMRKAREVRSGPIERLSSKEKALRSEIRRMGQKQAVARATPLTAIKSAIKEAQSVRNLSRTDVE